MKKLTLALAIFLLMGASCTLIKENKEEPFYGPIDDNMPLEAIPQEEMIKAICSTEGMGHISNISKCDNYYVAGNEFMEREGHWFYTLNGKLVATCGGYMAFDSKEEKQKNTNLCTKIKANNCEIVQQKCIAEKPKNEPITFAGEMTNFTEEIFGFSFEYPEEQLITKESVNGGGQRIDIELSVKKWPYDNVVKFTTIAVDASAYYQEKQVLLLENGKYQISNRDDSVELSAAEVIHNDLGEIAIFNGIEFTNTGLNTGEGLGYMAVMAIGHKYYLPIHIFANKDLISYEDFIALLHTIKKVSFTSDDCPTPELKSWGKDEYLRLCNRNTPFPAILFEELGIIMFVSYEGLEVIELEQPFDRNLVAKDVKFMANCASLSGLISCEMQADGPGSMTNILTINPANNAYIFAEHSTFGGKRDISFASSHSEDNFDARLRADCPPDGGGFGCNYADALSLDITINEQNYDKADYLNNTENIKSLFTDCYGFDFNTISAGWKGRNIDNIDIKNFPPKKLYCHNDDIDAYFDLEKNELIVE
jgi:hypothetical protein